MTKSNWQAWIKANQTDLRKLAKLVSLMKLNGLSALDIAIEFENAGYTNSSSFNLLSELSWINTK